MRRRVLPGLGAALCGALFVAAPADAATRWVAPGGLNTGTCTTEATACNYNRVLNGVVSVAGDEVIVKPGTYNISTTNVEINRRLDVRGQDGQPRPLFRDTNGGPAPFRVIAAGADTSIRHIEVEATATSAFSSSARITLSDADVRGTVGCATIFGPDTVLNGVRFVHLPSVGPTACLTVFNLAARAQLTDVEIVTQHTMPTAPAFSSNSAGLTADNLRISGGGAGLWAFPDPLDPGNPPRLRRVMVSSAFVGAALGQGAVLTDSVVRVSGTGSRALDLQGAAVVRNVTALASGSGSQGLGASATPTPGVATTARNLVVRGDGIDVHLDPDGSHSIFPPGDPICITLPDLCTPMPIYGLQLTLTHSNYRTLSGTLTPASTGNGSADPGFTDAAAGNFRPAPGSPLIDAGLADAAIGPTDLDGRPRSQGAAPDIGAYESEPPGAPSAQGSNPPAMLPAPPDPAGMAADTAGPSLNRFSNQNARFRVGREATAVATGRRRRAPVGTTFYFTSSEQATAMVRIARGVSGRRRGRSCVKPTRRLRRAKKCTRYVAVGTLVRPAMAGPNSVPFSGRIGRKALKPGVYMVAVSATDPAGNMTRRSVSGKFRVVKR